MSKIQDLKDKSDNNINIINVLSLFAPDVKNKTKYIETLARVFHNDIILNPDILAKKTKDFGFTEEQFNSLNKLEKVYLTVLLNEEENRDAFMKFVEFCEYNEKNALGNSDLQSYKSFKDVFAEHKKVKEKKEQKMLEKQVIKLLDDDEWLMVIPLTYESSLKYGSNTKWCTASTEYPSHYESYTKKGVLIYTINKKQKTKYAGYCEIKSFGGSKDISFWNSADSKVDGLSCGFSAEALKVFHEQFKLSEPNNTNIQTIEQLRKKALGTTKASIGKKPSFEKEEYTSMSGSTANMGMAEPAPPTNEAADYTEIYNTIVNYMGGRNRG